MSAPADTGIPGGASLPSSSEPPYPPSLRSEPPLLVTAITLRPKGRAVFLGELADHGRIGGIDGLDELIVGNRAADPQRVPSGAAYVRHHRHIVRIPQQPLVGRLPGAGALQAHRSPRSPRAGAEE